MAESGAHSTVSVMTYNILRGGEARLEQIASVVREVGPDVLVVVEAADDENLGSLAQRLGMRHVSCPARPPHHVAVLSPHPVRLIPRELSPNRRLPSITPALVRFPRCGERLIVGVHLSSQLAYPWGGRRKRLAEVRALLAALEAFRDVPHLLAGDFNAAPRDGGIAARRQEDTGSWFSQRHGERFSKGIVLSWLHEALQHLIARPVVWRLVRQFVVRVNPWEVVQLVEEAGYVDYGVGPHSMDYSWPSWSPAARIDHIFATPDVAADVVECYVLNTPLAVRASDHLPVVMRLRWC